MKNAFVRFLLKFSAILLFLAVATVTLFFAYGYRFDVDERSVLKTSIIDLVQRFEEVRVYLDGNESVQFMPSQLKGILPGKHHLEVQKNGFYTWGRDVLVEEDIVTIVEDVLLIPENIRDYTHEILHFPANEKVFVSDRYLLALKPGSQVLSIIELGDEGLWKEEEIGFYRSGFTSVDTFPGEKFLLHFDDGLMAYVSFPDRIFKTFALKPGVQKVRVDSGKRVVMFLDEGNLFSIPFDDLSEDQMSDVSPWLIRSDVLDYEPQSSGNILFLSAGMLFEISTEGTGTRLIEQSPGLYARLSLLEAGGYSSLILRDIHDARKLLVRSKNGNWQLLTDELTGRPLVHADGFVLYVVNGGDVSLYDITLEKEIPVASIQGDFEILGWFNSHYHFLIREGNVVRVRDIYDVNQTTLFEESNPSDIFIAANTLYLLEEGRLTSLSWEK